MLSAPSSDASMASWRWASSCSRGSCITDQRTRRRRLAGAVTTHDDHTGPSRRRRRASPPCCSSGALVGGACSAAARRPTTATATTASTTARTPVALPTLAGGLELAAVDPAQVLTGDGLAYGQPLPSQQAAADAFLEDPEVAAVTARRVYSPRDGRLVGEALVLALDGAELFDQGVLDAFVRGRRRVAGRRRAGATVELGGRTTIRSRGDDGTAIAYLEGNLLVVVRGADDARRRRRGRAAARRRWRRASPGAPDPRTPLVAAPDRRRLRGGAHRRRSSRSRRPRRSRRPSRPTLAGATARAGPLRRGGRRAAHHGVGLHASTRGPTRGPSRSSRPWPRWRRRAGRRGAGGGGGGARPGGAAAPTAPTGAPSAPRLPPRRARPPRGGHRIRRQLDAVVSAWIAAARRSTDRRPSRPGATPGRAR